MLRHLVEAFIAFFVVVNPFSKIPLFASLAAGYTPAQQRRIAVKSTGVAAAILVFFIALGQILFDYIGVNLYAFKAAGGCILLILSLQMVMGLQAQQDISNNQYADISIFPIALPYIAGPATIMTAILQTDNDLYSVYEQTMVTLVLFIVLGINFLFLLFAPVINRVLGKAGNDVLTRVLGLILAAIAMQSIFSGVAGFFHIKLS
ncbi:MAG: MarC family protein [Verrucomicrobia bacterium]|nr:MarC family protein [Verrucomicrobiota bacterium]